MKITSIFFLLILISIVSYSKPKPILKSIAKKLNSFQTYQTTCERIFSFPYGGTMTFESTMVTQKIPSDTLCGFYYNFEIAKNTEAGEIGDFSCYFNNQVFNSYKGEVKRVSLLESPEAFKDLKVGGGYRPAIQRSHQLFNLTPPILAKEIEDAIDNKNWTIVQNTDTIVAQEQCLRFTMESNKVAENPLNSSGEINEVHTFIEMYFNKSKLYPVYYAKKIKTSSFSTFNTTYFRNTKINPVLPQNYFSEENLIHKNPIGGVKPAEKEMLNPSNLIGQKAPEWELPVLGKDELLSNTDLLGKYILLEFTATWCGSCIPAVEMMNRIENKFNNVKNVAIVSIFSSKVDTKDGILKFVEKNKLRSTVLYSATEVEKKYHISSYPNFLIISPKGKVLIYYQGYNETVEKNIFSMLSEFVDLKDSTIKDGIIITDDKSIVTPVPSSSVKPDLSGEEHTPLYILDGVIVDKTQFKAVKPDDIKSISILKSKSATDKYGEKAKNGVVEIILKKENVKESNTIAPENIVKGKVTDSSGIPVTDASATVTGTVTLADGRPLQRVPVRIKGTNTRTLTDKDGLFKMVDVPNNCMLEFQNVGLKSSDVKPDFENPMNVKMELGSFWIDRVKVICKAGDNNSPKPLPKHGFASNITASPLLFVLDGVIVDKSKMDQIEPDDIKLVSILRANSATEKYGQLAKNGVMEITTKGKVNLSVGNVVVEVNEYADGQKMALHNNNIIDEMPEFKGGMKELMKFISGSIKYPDKAQAAKIQRNVEVNFVINRDGKVENVSIANAVDTSLDAEAIRVISSMPDWNSGKQSGEPVDVSFTIPIQFAIK